MTIQPATAFKDNLDLMPAIDDLARIELIDQNGTAVATIENLPGKQGSLAVYQYLAQSFGSVTAEAAEHGLLIFAEHTADAKNRPGAHPNIDILLAIANGGPVLDIQCVAAG